MLVLAALGILVPMEEKPRSYISDTPPDEARGFEVPDSVYYRRRIIEGDLVEVEPAAVAEGDQVEVAEVVPAESPKKKGGK